MKLRSITLGFSLLLPWEFLEYLKILLKEIKEVIALAWFSLSDWAFLKSLF